MTQIAHQYPYALLLKPFSSLILSVTQPDEKFSYVYTVPLADALRLRMPNATKEERILVENFITGPAISDKFESDAARNTFIASLMASGTKEDALAADAFTKNILATGVLQNVINIVEKHLTKVQLPSPERNIVFSDEYPTFPMDTKLSVSLNMRKAIYSLLCIN